MLVASLLSLVTVAQAEDPTIRVNQWMIAGTKGCNKNDVQLLTNGNSFSFLFNSFQSQLRPNNSQDGYASVRACVVNVLLELPRNYCIDSVDQTVSGGILKSRNTFGLFHFYTWFNGGSPAFKTLTWNYGQEITPDFPESLFTATTHQTPYCLRSRYQWYGAYIYFLGTRSRLSENFLGAVDSIDGDFTVRLKLR